MENNKQSSTLKSKIFKILPKAAASVSLTFQNPPFSPGRDHKSRTHGGKGFSGPMIPHEARRKPKAGGIETQEPTSPKVSCMGQIKHKKKQIEKAKAKAKTMSLPTAHNTRYGGAGDGVINNASSTPRETENEVKKKQHVPNKFQRMFSHAAKPKTGSRKKKLSDSSFVSVVGGEENINKGGVSSDHRAPPVGQMKRFASGRETFSNFDWRAQIAPEEMDHRDCFTDDDRGVESDAEEEDDDDVIIPFSAPILGGGGDGGRGSSGLNLQPRKEINLWKRRTMTPPMPLQLKPVLTAK